MNVHIYISHNVKLLIFKKHLSNIIESGIEHCLKGTTAQKI